MDVARQERLKVLARQADERWNAKASFLDQPRTTQQAIPATRVKDGGGYVGANAGEDVGVRQEEAVRSGKQAGDEIRHDRVVETQLKEDKKYKDDPWKKAKGGPSEQWQPKAWDPSDMPAARR